MDKNPREYENEAKRRWGGSAAWREYESREPGSAEAEGLMKIFSKLGRLRHEPAESPAVREAVAELRDYISANYYTCTPEIFRGLGRMYVSDPRFKENIDRAGGPGTAEFAARAIELNSGS